MLRSLCGATRKVKRSFAKAHSLRGVWFTHHSTETSSCNKRKALYMREWRNWQTRTFEGRVVHTVRVQVPFLAPKIPSQMRWYFFYLLLYKFICHTLVACGSHNRGSSPVSRTKNTIANAMVFFLSFIIQVYLPHACGVWFTQSRFKSRFSHQKEKSHT